MFASVVFSVLATAASSRALPWIIGMIIDRAILPKDSGMFVSLVFLYLGVEILKTFFFFIQSYYFQVFGNKMLYYIREDLYRHVLHLPLEFFNKTPVGRVVTRMTNDVGALGELFSEGIVAVFTQSVILIATIVAMSILSWKLTLITLATAPIYVYLVYLLTKRVRLLLHETKSKLSAMNAFLAENISGIRITQLYNRTEKQNQIFDKSSAEYRDVNIQMLRSYAWLQPVLNLFNATLITSALYAGGYFNLEGALPLGAMITFLMYSQDFIHPIRDIMEKIQQFQNSLTSAERVFHLMEEPSEQDQAPRPLGQLRGQIEMKNLFFSYRPELPPALSDINLKIEAGESVALVGRTGSGKTTFISLLQRFYDVPPQTLFIDGEAIENLPRKGLRRRLGVIQQDPVLFRGTLEFNVSLGHPDIDPTRVKAACQRAGLKLAPDLFIEERGANLSLGERQLVAFARIFAFDPEILILDEATANIDSETEVLLKKATLEATKGRTSLVIAHRLSTIEHCDRVIVLEQGRVAEMGAPAELLAQKGLYAQLAEAGVKSMRISASADGIADP
ncbi:MAG: ABC transporter ATP-binding protein [Bdellovibrionaceae bacterium]|nr:ABC transporter ATP-binding protein [Pseudobdellovibrionaceae bacterium]